MPSLAFFRDHGIFVEERFFDAAACARLRSEIRRGQAEKYRLVKDGSPGEVLDEDSKRSWKVRVNESTEAMVVAGLGSLKPRLEKHFALSFTESTKPAFLRYGEGSFCKPHRDADAGAAAKFPVAVVVLLSAATTAPAADGFGGGELRFYGLLDGPGWEGCGFPVEAEAGSLLAFRSDVVHEVRPVTFGERFTIVSWLGVGTDAELPSSRR
ncbi:MAG: 2OG-Fe(II) oxygenase [Elusimicrobiota bacterium]